MIYFIHLQAEKLSNTGPANKVWAGKENYHNLNAKNIIRSAKALFRANENTFCAAFC